MNLLGYLNLESLSCDENNRQDIFLPENGTVNQNLLLFSEKLYIFISADYKPNRIIDEYLNGICSTLLI